VRAEASVANDGAHGVTRPAKAKSFGICTAITQIFVFLAKSWPEEAEPPPRGLLPSSIVYLPSSVVAAGAALCPSVFIRG
jgi:hypothetical protein